MGGATAVKFVHSSDWHIGRPFARFPAEVREPLRKARLDSIDRLADVARENGCGIVLVAGDVFDGPDVPDESVRKALARLAAHQGLRWVVLPGNHDPGQASGIWDRVAQIGTPDCVTVARTSEPIVLGGNAFVVPAPLQRKVGGGDATAAMAGAQTPDGAIRIGLAHGAVTGFEAGSDGGGEGIIPPDLVGRAALDYLALGDWHGAKEVSTRAWYSGTPEPDKFPKNAPGAALVVDIAGPRAVPNITRVPTATFDWQRMSVDVSEARSRAALEATFADFGPRAAHTLVRLQLDGALTLSAQAELEDTLQSLRDRLFHLRVRNEKLSVAADAADFDALGDESIAMIARKLASAEAADGDARAARVANKALQHLYRLAARDAGAP